MKPLIVLLAITLVLILDVTGTLHVYGLGALMSQTFALGSSLVLGLIALGWLLVAFQREESNASRIAPRTLQRIITFLMLLASLANARNVLLFIGTAQRITIIGLFLFGIIGFLIALIRLPSPGWLVVGSLLFGSCIRLICYAAVPLDPTHDDMLPLVQLALHNFVAGQSPYTTYAMPWSLPLTYLPLTWLAYLPSYWLGFDIRLSNLCAELAIGGALIWLAMRQPQGVVPPATWRTRRALAWAGEPRLLFWAWLFLLPSTLNWSLATTGPIFWALLAWCLVFMLAKRQTGVVLTLGLCGAASPLSALMLPFIGLHWFRQRGWRSTLGSFAWTFAITALFVLPFFLWSPRQFLFGTWQWFNDNNLYPRIRWDMDQTWARQIGVSGIFWRHGLVGVLKPIQATLLAALALLFAWYGATARQLAPYLVAAYLLFNLFNPVLWPYLYVPAVIAALVTLNQPTGVGVVGKASSP